MFDQIQFTVVPGNDSSLGIKVLSLSTCGFCRRGMEYLAEQGFAYEFAHLDQLEPSVKQAVKEEFKEAFQSNLSYPALILGNGKFTVGYIQKYWEELLGIKTDPVTEVEPLE